MGPVPLAAAKALRLGSAARRRARRGTVRRGGALQVGQDAAGDGDQVGNLSLQLGGSSVEDLTEAQSIRLIREFI